MLAEFALDPALLSNWRDCRFFLSQFGAAQGRLISRFPKKWKGLVKEAARDAGEVEFLKITNALERIDSVMLIREYDYNKGHAWLRNAVDENARRPFRGIVSTQGDTKIANLMIGEDIDPTDPHELWVVTTSVTIERRPDQMAACVVALLSQCEEVLFIDPYFGPGKRSHTGPLKKFLEAIASRGQRRMPTRIEYHSGNHDLDTTKFQHDLVTSVQPHLPPSVELSVVRWQRSQMHNRYIITDRGGVMFGHGLDQDDSHPVKHDTVSLLDDDTCAKLMVDYSERSQKLTWLGEVFSVTGT